MAYDDNFWGDTGRLVHTSYFGRLINGGNRRACNPLVDDNLVPTTYRMQRRECDEQC